MGGWDTGLVPELRDAAQYLLQEASRAGLQPRITSAFRSYSQQTRLYRRFLRGQSRFPALPPGSSAHEYGEAFDMVVSPEAYLADVGAFWTSLGGAWGSTADPVHFELPGASARAKAAGEPSGVMQTVDIARSFALGRLPVIGQLGTVAWLASLIPGLTQNQYLKLLSDPAYLEAYLGFDPFSITSILSVGLL